MIRPERKYEQIVVSKFLLYYLIMGTAFCFLILPVLWKSIMFKKTTGNVRQFVYFNENNHGGAFIPLVDYSIEDKWFSFYGTDVERDELNDGQRVNVLYNPDNPKEAYIYTFAGFWSTPLMFFIPIFVAASSVLLAVGLIPKKIVLKI